MYLAYRLQIIRKSCILDSSVLFVACSLDRLFQHLIHFIEVKIAEQR
jgi:hypothetical protein